MYIILDSKITEKSYHLNIYIKYVICNTQSDVYNQLFFISLELLKVIWYSVSLTAITFKLIYSLILQIIKIYTKKVDSLFKAHMRLKDRITSAQIHYLFIFRSFGPPDSQLPLDQVTYWSVKILNFRGQCFHKLT